MEYNDSRLKIKVYNLPLFKFTKQDGTIENPLILKNIKTPRGDENIEIIEGIKLIEFSLNEIIDFLIKKSLNDKAMIHFEYYIIGGKAINNIIKLNYLEKSFDFDIHVKQYEDILNISRYITNYCNEELAKSYNKHYKKLIYKKLRLLNLVDHTCRDYYISNNHLIFYGDRISRINPAYKISGLFLKLKLRNNLFKHNDTDINYTNYLGTVLGRNDLIDIDPQYNILYIPIADIDQDSTVTFGINVYNDRSEPSIYKNPLENIKYADLSILLFNLLKCIAKVPNKIKSNSNKLKKLIKPLYYNCNMYNTYDSIHKFNEMYNKIITRFNLYKDNIIYQDGTPIVKSFIDDNNIPHLDNRTTYGSFIEKLINKLISINNERFRNKNCRPIFGKASLFLSEYNPIFKSHSDRDARFSELEDIIAELDRKDNYYYFLQYTGKLSQSLNIYCLYFYNNIDTTMEYPNNNTIYPIDVKGTRINIVIGRLDYNHALHKMNEIYSMYHNDARIIRIKDNDLSETFNIYSLQHITNFTVMEKVASKSFIDLSYIKQGDIIQISQFLSGTFNPQFNFGAFISDTVSNRIFLKININKNNKNWILLYRYSKYPDEFEILLKANSIYIIKSIDYEIVSFNSDKKEFKVITLELCDDSSEDVNQIFDTVKQKVLKSCGFNQFDNILKAPLFIKVLRYVYTTYFKKPYSDTGCEHLKDGSWDVHCVDDLGNQYDSIIYRNNHSLAHTVRVACWIQLLYLQDLLYNSLDIASFDQTFLMKTCIASIFMISGRESEASARDNQKISRDCPHIEPNPHNRYSTNSANNFKTYVKSEEIRNLELFTLQDIEDYTYCIKYYWFIDNDQNIPTDLTNNITINNDSYDRQNIRKKISTYFDIAHGNDLVRCFPELTVSTLVPRTHKSYKNEEKINARLMYDIMNQTGDRILSTQIRYDDDKIMYFDRKWYDAKTFYLCSTNPEHCITVVLDTTYEYYNQLIYNIKERIILKDTDYKEDFRLRFLSTDKAPLPRDSTSPMDALPRDSTSARDMPSSGIYPILSGGAESTNENAFLLDDNNIDIDSINLQVNNSNLGSTYYMSNSSYIEKITTNYNTNRLTDDFTNNGIYFQNIFISFNKVHTVLIDKDDKHYIDDEQNIYEKIINKKPEDKKISNYIYNYEKYVYPQYFIKTVKNLSTEEQIKKYMNSITEERAYEDEKKLDQKFFKIDTQLIKQLPKETPSKLKDIKISDDTVHNHDRDPDSVMDFRSKYLKYKKKYLELKNKLNL